MEFGLTSTGSATVTVSRLRRLLPWVAGVLGVLVASAATPQGNIDAGKSPAQLFADTCSNCHRRPSELKRTTAGFLRQHYTPGSQEAAAMASYLAGIPTAAPKDRPQPKAALEKEKEKAKVQQQAQERPQAPQDRPQPKAQQQQPLPKGKRPELAKSPGGEPPADAPQEVRVEAPPVPKLEPFEE